MAQDDDGPWTYYQSQDKSDKPAAGPSWPSRIAGAALSAVPGGQIAGGLISSETGQNVIKGGLQGAILDPIEGAGQLVEQATGARAPQAIRAPLKSFRSGVESTTAGEVGRVAGGVGSMFIPVGGELGALARAYPGMTSTLAGLARAATQPVEGGDFWKQKAVQTGLGALPPAVAATPWARSALAYLASRGAVVVPAAAAAHVLGVPHAVPLTLASMLGLSHWHSPLGHLMRSAGRSIGRPIERGLRRSRRVPGIAGGMAATTAQGVGRVRQEEEPDGPWTYYQEHQNGTP